MIIKFFVILMFLSASQIFAFLPYKQGGREEWELSMRQGFEKLRSNPTDFQIEYLGDLVKSLNEGYRSNETAAIESEATEILISIPGHALYYQEKIESMRAEALFNYNLSREEREERRYDKVNEKLNNLVEEDDYVRYARQALQTLGYLPSPETVSVLGHFLNDPEGRDPGTTAKFGRRLGSYDASRSSTNSELAVGSIEKLGIDHPPLPFTSNYREGPYCTAEEIDAWKDWWNEVAAGKRTYRFIGSDVEYGPDGPVSKEVLERIKRDQKRDEERAAGRNRSSSTEASSIKEAPKPWTIGALIASCLLCAGAVWYFLKNRKVV